MNFLYFNDFLFFIFLSASDFHVDGVEQDQSCRESDYRVCWLARNHRILDWLLYERSSIICLQVCMFMITPVFLPLFVCAKFLMKLIGLTNGFANRVQQFLTIHELFFLMKPERAS